MAEKLEVTTSESAFQLHLPSVVINVCNDVNMYLGKKNLRKSAVTQESQPTVHADVQWYMLYYVQHNRVK